MHIMMLMSMQKPFLKWLGGKRRLMPQILQLLPPGRRLVEPFVGGAAVFMGTDYDDYLLADASSDLINVYKVLRRDGDDFIDKCSKYFTPENNKKEIFKLHLYEYRHSEMDDARRAAIYIYLNRHGFRGKMVYTKKDKLLSCAFGYEKKPYFPRDEMIEFYKKSQLAEFRIAGFEETIEQAVAGDVIYCDPPYSPLGNSKEEFVGYTADGFSADDHMRLASLAEQAADRGIPVLISNHDTDFTRDLYSRATKISTVDVTRLFGRRQKASELLALYEPR